MVAPLFFACAPDSPVITSPAPSYLKAFIEESSNPLNPYNYAGALRNRILDRVLSELPKGLPQSELLNFVAGIAETDSEFQSLKTPMYNPLSISSQQGLFQSTPTVSQAVNTLPLSKNYRVDTSFMSNHPSIASLNLLRPIQSVVIPGCFLPS